MNLGLKNFRMKNIHLGMGLLAILLMCSGNAFSQSGRIKGSPTPTPTPRIKGDYILTEHRTKLPETKPKTEIKAPPPLESKDIIKVESALVPISASVVDRNSGIAITNLNKEDFELKIDGKIVGIDELFHSELPVRLALLIDNSSSVSNAREFEQKAAVKFLRRVIRPDRDLAALFSVAGVTTLEQELTENVDLLVKAIGRFPKAKGATALLDGIALASNYLTDFTGKRVIVVVSDGVDNLSDLKFDDLVKIVQENDCQVYVVNTNDFENFKRSGSREGSANLRLLRAERRMNTLAEETGGTVYSPIDEEELEVAFKKISAELSRQYVLGYYPGTEIRDGRFHTIDVKVLSDKPVDVRARNGFYTPNVPIDSEQP